MSTQEKVEVNASYLKDSAIKADSVRESKHIDGKIFSELLPQSHVIPVHRDFQTQDPTILEYWYTLSHKGQFGNRLAHLISLDAYGKIPQTSRTAELSTDDKVDQIASTLTSLANALVRTQKLTEHNMSSQAKVLNYVQKVGGTVKSQGAVLDVIKAVLTSETDYTHEDIKYVLEAVKGTFDKIPQVKQQQQQEQPKTTK